MRKIINKKNLYLLLLFVISLFGITLIPTYAKFSSNYTTEDDVVGLALDFNISITNIEEYNDITISGNSCEVFNVEITNDIDATVYYGVWHNIIETTDIVIPLSIGRLKGTTTSTSGSIEAGATVTVAIFVINMNDSEVTIEIGVGSSTTSIGDIEYLDGKRLIKGILAEPPANEPNLGDGNLIPVYYDDTSGIESWKVADSSNENNSWYNYSNQEWANAVVLNSDVNKSVGETIDISSDVRAMFVWVPRYQYKIAPDNSKEIFINFISKEQQTADSGYIIHPAFTFGTQELSGIWVGKFETSMDASTQELYVIPNAIAVTEQIISTQFTLAQNFTTNVGLSYLDSHMMKNTEWTAAAYLSQSKYGKFGNKNYSEDNKEVYVNNSSNLYTGSSSGSPNYISSDETIYSYDYGMRNGTFLSEENGIGASTTGNITGIYDMNGGTYEYVMGYLTTASSTFGATSSYDYAEFSTTPESKYYDNYTSETSSDACSGATCYGHGFEETAGWYNDNASYLTTTDPWVMRGGVFDSGSSSGIFAYVGTLGYSGSYATFRLTLSPTN